MTIVRFYSMIGDVLLRLRLERNVSQVTAAERAGVIGSQVSRWERGNVMPDTDSVIGLLEVYGQRLVVMPADRAETSVDRDAVVETAKQWKEGVADNADLLAAVNQLLTAEARQK